MLKHSLRCLAGLGLAGALVAASATPAVAAADIEPYFQDTTLAAGSTKTTRLLLYADEPTTLNEVSVRYDYRSLASKITIAPADGQECAAPEPGVLVCEERFGVSLSELPPLGSGIYRGVTGRVNMAATPGAQLGDSGDVVVSFQAAGGQRGSHTSRVRVGEGVDLAGGPFTTHSSRPGGKVSVPLAVSNAGKQTIRGFVAVFELSYSVRARDRFSNCLYSGDHLVSCEFDEEIPVGEGVSTTLNLELARDTYAPSNQGGSAEFMTRADFEDLTRVREAVGGRAATGGNGPKLTLTEASNRVRQADQTDVGPGYDYTGWTITVAGRNGTDLAAIGDTLRGRAGAVVTATVGFRNNGPATLDKVNADGEAATHTVVELPPGTTAVGVPAGCQLRPGTRTYQCASEMLLVAGKTYTMDFRLRIDRVVPHSRGTVLVNAPCECPGGGTFEDDIRPANDRATIVVNAAQSGGGGGGQGEGNDGGAGGGGGSLPVTGHPTGPVAGIGALLLVAGVAVCLLARRRTSRFVA